MITPCLLEAEAPSQLAELLATGGCPEVGLWILGYWILLFERRVSMPGYWILGREAARILEDTGYLSAEVSCGTGRIMVFVEWGSYYSCTAFWNVTTVTKNWLLVVTS